MADSFALTDTGVVLQQPAPTVTGPRITLDGGGGGRASHAVASQAPGGDFLAAGQHAADMTGKALTAIGQLAGNALAPYIEETQRRAYYDGMSQVVQGKALQDIHREQPWYTRIFGPSATVQGAQALTALTAISKAQSEAMAAMPELRKQHPDAMRQFMVEQATRIGSTGDATVDGLIQQKLTEQWPTMLATHMNQHYAWQQEDMGNKFVNMQVANGKLLQDTMAQQQGFATPEQMQVEVQKFHAGLARPAGMLDDVYGQYMNLAAKSQLQNGNFMAYEAMKQDPKVWEAIPPEARMALEKSEDTWAQRALLHAPALTGITTDLGKFEHMIRQGAFLGSEDALHFTIDKFNEDFKRESGSASDMINNAQRARLIQQFYQAREHANSAFAKIQQGYADAQAQRNNVFDALNAGDPARLAPNVSEGNARDATEEVWDRAKAGETDVGNTIDKLALVSWEKKLRVGSLESQLKTDAAAIFSTGGDLTKRQIQSLEIMRRMLASPRGISALADYTSAADAARIQAFLKTGVDLQDPKVTLETRNLIRDGWGAHVTKEDRDAAVKYIKSQETFWFWQSGALDNLELNDATKAWMAEGLAPYTAMVRKSTPGVDAKQAAQLAFSTVYGNPGNMDFVDGTIVPKNPYLPGAQSLFTGVRQLIDAPISQSSKDYQTAVRDVLHDRLIEAVDQQVQAYNAADKTSYLADARHFVDTEYKAVSGTQMQNGWLTVHYLREDGQHTIPIIISPAQVLERYKQNMNKPQRIPGTKPLIEQYGASRIGNPEHDPLAIMLRQGALGE